MQSTIPLPPPGPPALPNPHFAEHHDKTLICFHCVHFSHDPATGAACAMRKNGGYGHNLRFRACGAHFKRQSWR